MTPEEQKNQEQAVRDYDPDKPIKYLKVTTTEYYAVPMHNEINSVFDGMELVDVANTWFSGLKLNAYDEGREHFHVQGIKILEKIEVADEIENVVREPKDVFKG